MGYAEQTFVPIERTKVEIGGSMAEKVVCLGWGSLVWRLGDLPVERFSGPSRPPWACCVKDCDDIGDWQCGGPRIRVEFMRQSGKTRDRVTLVLHEQGTLVTSFWARMTVYDLEKAKQDLAVREGTRRKSDPTAGIDHWSTGDPDPKMIPGLESWATSRDIDHVIWTALKSKFEGFDDGKAPPVDKVIEYLKELSKDDREAKAREYVRCTPPQIDTAYRQRIVDCLGPEWAFPAAPAHADVASTDE